MLGGPQFATLEVEIYTQALYMLNLRLAAVLSLVQLACTLLVAWLQSRVSQPRYGQAAMSAERANLRPPRGAAEKTFTVVMIIILVLLILTPLLSLITRSFVTLEAARGERGQVQTGFTLRYYQELFQNRTGSLFYVPPITAVRNSLVYAALTVVIAIVLGLLGAYALNQPWKANRILEPFFMLPLGASAVTLGLGFLVTFRQPAWSGLPFPLLIPIAHALVALPMVVRTLLPALRSIPASLRQAASTLGADNGGCSARSTCHCSYGHCW